MKLSIVMALIALGMTLVAITTYFIDVPVAQRPGLQEVAPYPCCGQVHENIDTMLIGGSGAARGAHLWGLSFVFGALILAMFVCCILLGLRRNGAIGPAGKLVIAGAALYFLAYAALMLSYRQYMTEGSLETFGALPLPTAWMMYALWPVPFVFLGIFVLGFRRYIWDDESERAFQKLVADKRTAEGNR